jgi:hypothetical protein
MKNCWFCETGIVDGLGDMCNRCRTRHNALHEAWMQCHEAGVVAYRDGKNLCDNPHTVYSPEFANWTAGWYHARIIHEYAQNHPEEKQPVVDLTNALSAVRLKQIREGNLKEKETVDFLISRFALTPDEAAGIYKLLSKGQ